MAHVLETKNGKWECVWDLPDPRSGKRKFQSKRFDRKADAMQHKRDIENRRATGLSTDQKPGKAPFSEVAEAWLAFHKQHLKPSTARQYRSVLDSSVLPHFGYRPIASITRSDVRDYITALSESGRSAPTIRRHFGVLRLVFEQAAEDGAIPRNPATGLRLPTDKSTGRTPPASVFLSANEVEDLATPLSEPYDFLIRFLAYTGLRVGEASGLNIEDVNMRAKRQISVRRTRAKVKGGWEEHVPKNGRPRKVPLLTAWLQEDMSAYLAAHPRRDEPNAPLFPGATLQRTPGVSGSHRILDWGKPWEPGAFRKRQYKPALLAAGLPSRTRLHDLRHTAASLMLEMGIPPYRVAEYLGHSLQVLTMVYAHILPDAVDSDVARFPAARPTTTPENVTRLSA